MSDTRVTQMVAVRNGWLYMLENDDLRLKMTSCFRDGIARSGRLVRIRGFRDGQFVTEVRDLETGSVVNGVVYFQTPSFMQTMEKLYQITDTGFREVIVPDAAVFVGELVSSKIVVQHGWSYIVGQVQNDKFVEESCYTLDNWRAVHLSSSFLELQPVEALRLQLKVAAAEMPIQRFEALMPFVVGFRRGASFSRADGIEDLRVVRTAEDLQHVMETAIKTCRMIVWNVVMALRPSAEDTWTPERQLSRKIKAVYLDLDTDYEDVVRKVERLASATGFTAHQRIKSANGRAHLIDVREMTRTQYRQLLLRIEKWCAVNDVVMDAVSKRAEQFCFLPEVPIFTKALQKSCLVDN